MEMLSKMETNITNNIDPYAYRLAELRSEHGHLVIPTRIDKYIEEFLKYPGYSINLNKVSVGGAIMCNDTFHIAIIPEAQGFVGRQIIKAIEWGFTFHNPFKANISKNGLSVKKLIDFFPNTLLYQDKETFTFNIYSRGK